MKPNREKSGKKTGFTIVELLTVMSIIVILISLLVPALNRVRRYATLVKQKAQFHAIGVALDLFGAENGGYPDSKPTDDAATPLPYCGAMKLAEAMVGQDLKGFHPASRFRREGFARPNVAGVTLYPAAPDWPTAAEYAENLKSRRMYLQLENANAFLLDNIYLTANITTAGYDPNTFVLCDVYNRVTNRATGKKIGMPILYYKADSTKTKHVYSTVPGEPEKNIYDYRDNNVLVSLLGIPWAAGFAHPMASGGITSTGAIPTPQKFYDGTQNKNISGGPWPYRADSYILMSAGFDGEYGNADDVFNFGD